jgi:choice-of-anchor A domain-containing protein
VTIDPLTGNVPNDGSGMTLSALKTSLTGYADFLGGLADQGVVTKELLYSTLTLTGNDPLLNVFNITASDWAASTININAPTTSTVLINIAGTTVNWSGSGMTINGDASLTGSMVSQVMYNFVDATSINGSSRAILGSVLAMHSADTTISGGSVNGLAIFGGNLNQLNGFEPHNAGFDGNLPSMKAVPEPASIASACIGLVMIAGAGWFRRRRAN